MEAPPVARKPTPKPSNLAVTDKRRQRETAADDVLAREVDEAVRQDQMSDIATRYGKPIAALVVVALVAFAGYLFWDSRNEAELEGQSEAIVSALDQIEAGNLDSGSSALAPVAETGSGGRKGNRHDAPGWYRAGTGQQCRSGGVVCQGRRRCRYAGKHPRSGHYPRSGGDLRFQQSGGCHREAAAIGPCPKNPYFGSAGEMVAMSYLEQGKRQQAGELFAQIAKADDVPEGLRSRARRMAGLLGVDAIEDVDALLEEVAGRNAGGPPVAAGPAAAE